ncbi:MAG: TIGR04211 family SH3 domain-containing protein [Proteobacteria bacterium]|nr:TIGR04211 family SH3 domain-containing protein [Pseudomonadota bacterium]
MITSTRIVCGVLLLLPLLAAAETAYVTDNLRLGLHQAADTSDRAFRSLDSGQALEVLSRDSNYAYVRLPDGVEGYVKVAYLVDDKPAKLIVEETQAEVVRLEAQLEELRRQFAGPAASISTLQQELSSAQSSLADFEARNAELTDQNTDLRDRQTDGQYSLPINWVAIATGICLVGGFLLGLWWVDRKSRQRHGGIRIY